MKRPSKDAYYMNIAKAVAQRSTCLRRYFGAILVRDDQIISTGYNGSPRGEPNCTDVGECYRKTHNIKPGTMYEECEAVHAEMNTVINAARAGVSTLGATMYLYGFDKEEDNEIYAAQPCKLCAKIIKNAGIRDVIGIDPETGELHCWDFRATYDAKRFFLGETSG